jgi:ParB family chromosome partitioning protein
MIDIDSITTDPSRRPPTEVEGLIDSFAHLGQLYPLIVTRDPATGTFRLWAGRRRLEAARRSGHPRVRCIVLDVDDVTAELAGIDENLVRQELSALERAEQTRRRKEIYEALHPGAARPRGGRRRKNGERVSSFSADTAGKSGTSPRSVQQDVQIAARLCDAAKELVHGTPLADRKADLLRLARLEPAQQVEAARLMVSGRAATAKEAERLLTGPGDTSPDTGDPGGQGHASGESGHPPTPRLWPGPSEADAEAEPAESSHDEAATESGRPRGRRPAAGEPTAGGTGPPRQHVPPAAQGLLDAWSGATTEARREFLGVLLQRPEDVRLIRESLAGTPGG